MSIKTLGIFGLLLALSIFMAIMTSNPWYDVLNGTFLQPNNIENLLRRTSMYGLLGIGVAFVIITGGIDLSIGSIVCLAGCLLALFLQVNYQAADDYSVSKIKAEEKSILLIGKVPAFGVGDRIRLSGARRAKNALLNISEVEQVQLENTQGQAAGSATMLTVEGDISRDDDSGRIAKVYPVSDFKKSTESSASELVLDGAFPKLRPRDQLTLVHPQQGQKQIEIVTVKSEKGSTTLHLQRDLGSDFSKEWLVIPQLRHQRMPVPLAILSVIGIAVLLGLIHGLLVTRVRLQPFVVTLCGLLIYRGASRWLVSDQPVGFGNEFTDTLSPLGSGKWVLHQWSNHGHTETFGIPYPLFILVFVAIAAAIFLNMTIWGRYLLALGRNEEAARYSGINTARITAIAYVICTVAAAMGGMLFAIDSNSVSPSSFGNFFELYAIAAAVLGGCSLRGGEGTVLGVIIGTAVMQILNNLILLMKISDELEFAIIGLVILIGVISDELIRRFAARRRAILEAKLNRTVSA
ncbi:MAG: ABC transporter permease [Pirellulaceae bacterium]|nr:ABC transporter permease [Pirellulaceae bacterium]